MNDVKLNFSEDAVVAAELEETKDELDERIERHAEDAEAKDGNHNIWYTDLEVAKNELEESIESIAEDLESQVNEVEDLKYLLENFWEEVTYLKMDINRMEAYKAELAVAIKKSEVMKEELRYDIECLQFARAVASEQEA